MTTFVGLLLLVALVATAAWVVAKVTEEPMDDLRRTEAPGICVPLSAGVTHYQLEGPRGGPVMVLVHGLTTPAFVFDALVPGLNRAGYQVLRYDLYGRGYSDRPKGIYDAAFFTKQLEELLAHLQIETPVVLTGYSMGGAVATHFAAQHPSRVKWLVLLAPGGLGHNLGLFLEASARLGPLGDWIMTTLGGPVLRHAFSRDYEDVVVPEFNTRLAQEPGIKGYLPAVLSSVRDFLEVDQTPDHTKLAAQQVPTLAIWGAEDDIIPASARAVLTQANVHAKHVVLEGADHDLPHKCPERVVAAMFDDG